MSTLERFVAAQSDGVFEAACAEIAAGVKRSHWMWFVFPQIAGLGRSPTARFYAIEGRDEAADYLAHELLGARLAETTRRMLDWAGRKSPEAILGSVDALKFRSSMTLFEAVAPSASAFSVALDAMCGGERDSATLVRL